MSGEIGVDVRKDVITVDHLHNALNLVTFTAPNTVERPEPACRWPKLCGQDFCRFPRYQREGLAAGLVSSVLLKVGYLVDLLKALDCEYEIGGVIHPGVKIARSRNRALKRIVRPGIALLGFLQEHQKSGMSWSQISVEAFRPRKMVQFLDVRRRPWLY